MRFRRRHGGFRGRRSFGRHRFVSRRRRRRHGFRRLRIGYRM